jgi:Ca2+-binding EF-hand superfamily protein
MIFNGYDKDHDGYLSKKELLDICKKLDVDIKTKQIQKCFSFMDKDNSGKVDFQEFYAFYKYATIGDDLEED